MYLVGTWAAIVYGLLQGYDWPLCCYIGWKVEIEPAGREGAGDGLVGGEGIPPVDVDKS